MLVSIAFSTHGHRHPLPPVGGGILRFGTGSEAQHFDVRWTHFRHWRDSFQEFVHDFCTRGFGGTLTGLETNCLCLGDVKKIWVFPKIVGFPPKSSILIGVFHYKPSILGCSYFWKHPHDFKLLFFFKRARIKRIIEWKHSCVLILKKRK